jgi:hypothetical protein
VNDDSSLHIAPGFHVVSFFVDLVGSLLSPLAALLDALSSLHVRLGFHGCPPKSLVSWFPFRLLRQVTERVSGFQPSHWSSFSWHPPFLRHLLAFSLFYRREKFTAYATLIPAFTFVFVFMASSFRF